MKRQLYFLSLLLASLTLAGCSDDDDKYISEDKTGPKPQMDIVASPTSDLLYGDNVTLSGLLTDERNLDHYEILLLNSAGDTVATKYQMLLGKEFNMNDQIQLPLPRNAQAENFTAVVKLDNTRNGEEAQSFDLGEVGVPTFSTLHLLLSNGQTLDMVQNGDVFETAETVFPANIKGIISTSTAKSGIWWGMQGGEVAVAGTDSLAIGGDVEASYKVYFNPRTFELSFSQKHFWSPLPTEDCYYILGTISGHWMDGEITKERTKMRMNGFSSDDDRYYTWTAPDGDDPEVGMWGSTAAGVFRLKKGGQQGYILWDGNKIVESATDNKDMSFPLTAGGPFTIKAYFSGNKCTSVEVSGGGRAITFADNAITINGAPVTPSVEFSGNQLKLKPGTSYLYEGTVSLTQGQTISSAFDLSSFTANPDLFSGGGNSTWKLKTLSGQYTVRMDPFSGAFYACPLVGYPDVIYMDGWSWAMTASSTAVVWDPSQLLPLVRQSDGTYQGTFYDFGWGGDVKFYVVHPSTGINAFLPNTNFSSEYVNASGGNTSFKIPSAAGYFKVIIDLKDGISISSDGSTVTPKGSSKFTIDYAEQ